MEHAHLPQQGTKQMMEAAKRTRNADASPFITISKPHHHWSVCNKIANSISSLCAPSFIHRDIVYHNMLSRSQEAGNSDDATHEMGSCASGDFISSLSSTGKDGVNIAANIESGVYLMALTCEPERKWVNAKIRVMLIQEKMVQQLLEDMKAERALTEQGMDTTHEFQQNGKSWTAKLEDPVHQDRWELIKTIVRTYEHQERRENGKLKWGKPLCDIELCTMSVSERRESAKPEHFLSSDSHIFPTD